MGSHAPAAAARRRARSASLLAVLLVAAAGLGARARSASSTARWARAADGAAVSSVRELGRVLFTDYAFAFEATSILILVAMVGAVVLARREGDA